MAQVYNSYSYPFSFAAVNKNLFITATETIILEAVSTAGFSKFGLTISNFVSPASNISVVKVYGSNDGINYYSINASALSTVTPGSTAHVNITGLISYIRVTATSAGTSNIDCSLVGTV